jgi:hypothetical protein
LEQVILDKREEWKIEVSEFVAILYQIGTAQLGLSGNGLFTISYKFIGSVS